MKRGYIGRRRWEQALTRARLLGPAGAARAAVRVGAGMARTRWRRLRAKAIGTAVGPRDLARAFAVGPRALAEVGEGIRQALGTRLPVGPDDAKAIVASLERYAPDAIRSTVAAADRICQHVFDLLGSGPVALGPEIDWHRDFKSGYRWDPKTFYTDVPYGHVAGVDIKVPWELSRGQHLPVLAQAYLFTGDERYAREAVAQIRHWLAANPPQFGVNWACPMDVGIRAVNWLWTAGLLADAVAADREFFLDLSTGLLAHGRFLRDNLEIGPGGITSNHYLADVVGLLYLGLCVPEFREAKRWRAYAVRALAQEMDGQVLPDGADYESSIPYHRLVTEMFLSAALLCRHHGERLPSAFVDKLARMLDFVRAYTKPNGLAPQVGDADDGRLHVLHGYGTNDPRDHRHLLPLGAFYFDRENWWAAAGPAWPEALWFGVTRGERWSHPPERSVSPPDSAAFPHAGLYIIRDGDDYVLFNCSPVGTRGIGNHKHNDLLSLEVHLGGEDILVDPGSYLYTPDPESRNAFRSTLAHCTVMVDGVEQNRFVRGGLFALHADTRPRVLAWDAGPTRARIVAEHDGYVRLSDPVLHRRTVTFERGAGRVEVLDEFDHPKGGGGTHDFTWTFPLAPGCRIESVTGGWLIDTGRQRVHLLWPCCHPGGEVVPVTIEIGEGWMSPRYGVRERAPVLRWRWRGTVPSVVRFALRRFGSR
ncbi:MAG: heparinase II/III domain-containing protein [Candidatus Methylomirabilales bacterium]